MRYTEKDIPGMTITAFLDALGEKSVGGYGYLKLYYAPYRDDAEALLVVDTKRIIGMTTGLMNPGIYMIWRNLQQGATIGRTLTATLSRL